MRILIVSQNYYPFVGGIEVHVRQIARVYTEQGHTVEVAAGNFFATTKLPRRIDLLHLSVFNPHFDDYVDGQVPIHALTPANWRDRVQMLPIAVRVLPRLQRYAYHELNRFGYPWYRSVYQPRLQPLVRRADVIHSVTGGYLGWMAQELAQAEEKPFVITPFAHQKQWGDGPDDVMLYRKADAVIGLTETDRDYLCSLGAPRDKAHVLGLSPDLAPTGDPAAFRAQHSLGNYPVVLYLGRLMAKKGAPAIMEAAPLVWQQMPETRFVFIGPGDEEEVKIFAGADERVLHIPKIEKQDKTNAVAACTLLCMPSLSELLGIVYLEAWAFRKPVVGGLAPGLTQLIQDHGAGLNVGQEPREVADALLTILRDPALAAQMGERGYAVLEAEYSVSHVTGTLLNLYQRLIDQKRKSGAVAAIREAA